MKATAMTPIAMKGHVENRITPYSISGGSRYPAPVTCRDNIKAKIKRMKLAGRIKLGRRQIHVLSIPELSGGDPPGPDIRFNNWRWDN